VESLHSVWLGRMEYGQAHQRQLQVRDEVAAGTSPPTLLLLEHEPIVTLGRRGSTTDLLVPPETFAERGIAVERVERGGLVTYHGPGQLVGYVIAPVRQVAPDLPTFVWQIEEALIQTVATYGIEAAHDLCHRGVWVGDAKLASLGLAVQHGISWHGFALNVSTDLTAFELIRACGLDAETTSLQKLLGSAPSVREVADRVVAQLSAIWGSALAGTGALRSER
jgi:lipoyl(octanoyl) transferase